MKIIYRTDQGSNVVAEIYDRFGQLVHTIAGPKFADTCAEAYGWVRANEVVYA